MGGDIETYAEHGQWKNRVEGNVRASNIAATRSEAVKTGRHMAKARKVDHIVRDAGGQVEQRYSYRPG